MDRRTFVPLFGIWILLGAVPSLLFAKLKHDVQEAAPTEQTEKAPAEVANPPPPVRNRHGA